MTTLFHARFVQGLILGVVFALVVGLLIILSRSSDVSNLTIVPYGLATATWIYANLGLSLPVFVFLLGLYVNTLGKLKRGLADQVSIEQIVQLDHLIDTWISLFFGVGVVWTAIGMRSALVYALGEPEVTLNLGAYAILERMVQGGILLALSTTIVGGVGGYVLRIIKILTVEADVKRYYNQATHAPGNEVQATLYAIEAHLQLLTENRALS